MTKKRFFVKGTHEFNKLYKSLDQKGRLRKEIDNAIGALKANPSAGNKIEKKLWPKRYVKEYGIYNLYRYPLGAGYRMIYTVISDGSGINSNLGCI